MVSPSGVVELWPSSSCCNRPPTRTSKNSSKLLAEMARNFTRSSSGLRRSPASSSTRQLNFSHDASRLKRGARWLGVCPTMSSKWNVDCRSGGNLVGQPDLIVYQDRCELRASSCEQAEVGVCLRLGARRSKVIGKGRRFVFGALWLRPRTARRVRFEGVADSPSYGK